MTVFSRRRGLFAALGALVLAAAAFSGCKPEPPKLTIRDAHAEFSEAMTDEVSIYLTIENAGGPDKLIAAKIDIPGASAAIHETRGDLMIISRGLRIPAGGSLQLVSFGSHIMVSNLPASVKQGDRFTLTLDFEKSCEMQVPVEVATPRLKPGTGRFMQPMEHGMP